MVSWISETDNVAPLLSESRYPNIRIDSCQQGLLLSSEAFSRLLQLSSGFWRLSDSEVPVMIV